jgi:hypothetical protein
MEESLKDRFESRLQAAVIAAGPEAVEAALDRLADQSANAEALTIIVNEGVHHLPDEYRRGRVYVASRGSLDFSTPDTIHAEFTRILRDAARVLKSRQWRKVYLVPFGPSTLSMQLKLLVYRVTDLETVDVMHVPHGPRVDIALSLREIIVSADDDRGASAEP